MLVLGLQAWFLGSQVAFVMYRTAVLGRSYKRIVQYKPPWRAILTQRSISRYKYSTADASFHLLHSQQCSHSSVE